MQLPPIFPSFLVLSLAVVLCKSQLCAQPFKSGEGEPQGPLTYRKVDPRGFSQEQLDAYLLEISSVYRGTDNSYGVRILPPFVKIMAGLPGVDLAFADLWKTNIILTRLGDQYDLATPSGILLAQLGGDYEVVDAQVNREWGGR